MKRRLFETVIFPEGFWYQDSVMRQVVLPLADKLGYTSFGLNESIVLYRQNPGGITKKSRAKGKSLQSLYLMMSLFEDRKQYGLELTEEYYDYILRMAVQTYSRTRLQSGEVKRAVFTVYADFVERNFAGFRTGDRKLAPLEKAIFERDYGRYLVYCQLH